MKASEMIKLLQDEQAKRGDVEVVLHEHCGETGNAFEVMSDAEVAAEPADQRVLIHIWTCDLWSRDGLTW